MLVINHVLLSSTYIVMIKSVRIYLDAVVDFLLRNVAVRPMRSHKNDQGVSF